MTPLESSSESIRDIALVTGAASGIGRATARHLGEAGWRVHATDVREEPLAELDCRTARLDVTDGEAIGRAVERIGGEDGGPDLVVHCAGYLQAGAIEDVPMTAIEQQMSVNSHGALRLARAVLPGMRERGGGTVVFVSSVLGRVVLPGAGVYAGSKHLLEAYGDALRRESGPVDVVLVEPSWVDTGLADEAADRFDDLDRSEAHAALYRAYERAPLLSGGPLAVGPEVVARRILGAAETADPAARIPVGRAARLIVWLRHLPAGLQDRILGLIIEAARRAPA